MPSEVNGTARQYLVALIAITSHHFVHMKLLQHLHSEEQQQILHATSSTMFIVLYKNGYIRKHFRVKKPVH